MWRNTALVLVIAACATLVAAGEESVSLSGPQWTYPLPPWLERPVAKAGGPTFEDQVMELVNQERLTNGALPPLKRNDLLDAAAEGHSFNMGNRNFFSHCDLDTLSSVTGRLAAAGYLGTSAAENIAAGYSTPAAVMAGWMASSGHRANILRTTVYELGIGYAYDAGDTGNVRIDQNTDCAQDLTSGPFFHYWTQDFGRRGNVYPVVIEREAYATSSVDVDLYLYGTTWGAVDMRLRNENGGFTDWQPFSADVAWQLSPCNGVKMVTVEIRNGVMTVLSASDTILLTGQAGSVFCDGFESGDVSAWNVVVP